MGFLAPLLASAGSSGMAAMGKMGSGGGKAAPNVVDQSLVQATPAPQIQQNASTPATNVLMQALSNIGSRVGGGGPY